MDSGAPQADVALAEAMTFMRQSKEIALLTLYESRINRNIRKNMEQLRELQTERKAQLEKDLEEAQLLAQLARSNGETFDPIDHCRRFMVNLSWIRSAAVLRPRSTGSLFQVSNSTSSSRENAGARTP